MTCLVVVQSVLLLHSSAVLQCLLAALLVRELRAGARLIAGASFRAGTVLVLRGNGLKCLQS